MQAQLTRGDASCCVCVCVYLSTMIHVQEELNHTKVFSLYQFLVIVSQLLAVSPVINANQKLNKFRFTLIKNNWLDLIKIAKEFYSKCGIKCKVPELRRKVVGQTQYNCIK